MRKNIQIQLTLNFFFQIRNNKIKELEEELEKTKSTLGKELAETKSSLKEHQELLGHGHTYENFRAKLDIYQEFSSKLRKTIVCEEKKRGIFGF